MPQKILRHADRDAIWHQPRHEAGKHDYHWWNAPSGPEEGYPVQDAADWLQGHPEGTEPGPPTHHRVGGQVLPFPHGHHPEREAPEHDWTQHGLGDPDDWEEANRFRQVDAALDANGNHQFPGIQSLQPTGESTASTHGAQVHQDPANGEKWLVKPAPASAPFLAHGDVAANAIQQYSGLKTPPTFLTEHEGNPASAQLMFHAKDAFPGKNFDPEKVSDPDLLTIQKHHALDWMLGNHDSHGGQFIRDDAGDLVGIDKGQSFKHYNQDRLHWNYHPNSSYNETEPIYNTLYRNYAQGGRQLHDPRQGELGQFIQHLQDIPSEEYLQTLKPYADGAAERGSLGKMYGGYAGHGPQRFKPNSTLMFLDHALERKNNLMNDMGDLYDRATAHRMTGTKIAWRRQAAPPSEHELQDEGEALGTNQRAHVYSDPQGQWIVKPPSPGTEYMVPLEVGTAALQKRLGLETPETHAVPFQGGLAVASKRYPNVSQAFERRPHLDQLSPQDQQTIQQHHVMDWLVGNHDAHVGNWLRNHDTGQLIGIDKGQALKYFGQDRLDPTFHPNYYAREPVYNRLWRDHAQGRGEMADPRQGPVGEMVKRVQSIPDDELKGMFAPYAHAAASVGHLATGGPPDPGRKLSPRRIPANDPDSFLDALVERKNNLHTDLGGLYDRATKARAQTQRSQTQSITPGLDPQSFAVHEAAGLDDVLSGGLGDVLQVLTPKTPGTTPLPKTPNAPTPPAAPTVPGAPPTPAGVAPGATPSTAPLPQSKGYDPAKQQGWSALGIPTGIPSTYHGPWHSSRDGTPSEYGGVTTTFGPGSPGYGHNPAGGGGAGGAAGGTGGTAPSTPGGTGGPGSPVNYSPTGGVEQWRPHVEEGLRRNGLPTTPDYVNKVLHQMQTESSGNPTAQNNTDSNAQKGTPSKGLLQTIDPTFQSHHLPGDANDPFDPQANIDAAIGYAKSRYGPSLMDQSGNGMGSGHGY